MQRILDKIEATSMTDAVVIVIRLGRHIGKRYTLDVTGVYDKSGMKSESFIKQALGAETVSIKELQAIISDYTNRLIERG